ncbi:low temperature requirement protein A [Micromonospora sp. CB01531]|uniref:low temperature requirement protein A n=1 Tax=Micromonospora sp. CB01531 TaxID=1718947 RepID=UPI001300FC7D|nr:low temperature requirement protein A [Micromonospora sp. CB01531]
MSEDDGASDGKSARAPRGIRPLREGVGVTSVELFFDLVFVLGFIQVVALMEDDFTSHGVLNGMLALALLWSTWSIYAWLGNSLQARVGLIRIALLFVTAVTLAMAVAVRQAFTGLPGAAISGPVVFVACFVVVRLVHLALRWYAIPDTRPRIVLLVAAPLFVASVLLFSAAVVPQRLFHDPWLVKASQTGLWMLAIIIDYGRALLLRSWGLHIISARHWAERHGLIVLVALGESLIAVGLTSSGVPMTGSLIAALVFAIVTAAALGWTYFDVVAIAAERTLSQNTVQRRVAYARDAYSYLHLPMIAGIMLLALGLHHVVTIIKDNELHHSTARLESLGLHALYGGAALFLLSHAGFQLRITRLLGRVIWPRLITVALLVALIPAAGQLSAVVALGLLAVICASLVITEVLVAGGRRKELREAALAGGFRPEGP